MMHRRLIAAGLHGRGAAKRPQNKLKRLKLVKKHQHLMTEQWNRFLWSDESKFVLFVSERRQFVCRRSGKRYDSCLQPTGKHGGGSVTVSGYISAFGIRKLVKINGMLTKEKYKQILQHHAAVSAP